MPGFHSPRSPSSAHRWRACPGSVRMEKGLPDEAGEDAIQGTVFHDVAADCLETGLEPFHFIGERIEIDEEVDGKVVRLQREFTREMATKMLAGLDLVWALADVPGAKLYVEKRVKLDRWIGPDESGTSDAFIIDPLNMRLTVFDWKWGGMAVRPEWNDQGMLYALGVWDTFAVGIFEAALHEHAESRDETFDPNVPWEDDITVRIIIEQPRAPGGGGVWDISLPDLLREGRRIRRAADLTEDPEAPLVPGEAQCKFCKAAKFNTCEVRARAVADYIGAAFDDLEAEFASKVEIDLHDARALTPEARSQILLHRPLIEGFLTQLHEEAMKDAEQGRPVPGLKRVPGRRGNRKWRDEKKAEIMLVHDFEEEAHVKKLKSPAAIEDDVGAKAYQQRYERLVEQGEAKPILVSEDDPRERLPSVDEIFDDMAGDDLI